MATQVSNPKTASRTRNNNLIEECKKGDQKAQFLLYKLYYKAMLSTSLSIIDNPMEAEDIIQESFLTAFDRITTFSGTVSFGEWVRTIVINRTLDALVKRNEV